MDVHLRLTDDQVAALRDRFGADVDIAAITQAWVGDWLVQFTRVREEKQMRAVYAAYLDASADLQVQLLKPAVAKLEGGVI